MLGTALLSLFLTWVQVSSDTYIVKSSAGEERAKRVLKELEGFHQLVGSTLVFANTKLPELPIEVLLVGDEQTLRELEPEYNGRKLSVAGYYQSGNDRDFIVLSGRVYPETLTSLVYHELTHYFIARGLKSRPTWLNEGLAEYFSTAEVRDDEVLLGALSTERLQLLKTAPLLSLKDFFAVDSSSAYYNETSKASVYYAQAWAFMHYMMHGEHSARFRQYLKVLQKSDANLLQYLNISEREVELGFQNYLKSAIQRSARNVIKVSGENWAMSVESIPDTEAQISIAEIFLAGGRLTEARHHLELLASQAPDSTRVSYYRGILARIAGRPEAREMFVDALLDPFLAPRAAVQLVAMGEAGIPAVRRTLQEAADMQTRNPEVYLALGMIYGDEARRIEEAVRLQRMSADAAAPARLTAEKSNDPAVEWQSYMHGTAEGGRIEYDLQSASEKQPHVTFVVAPYYPAELLAQRSSGEVVIDVQVAEDGKVGGMWVVSASPEFFETLATSSVRDWQFDRVPAKIRVVVRFKP